MTERPEVPEQARATRWIDENVAILDGVRQSVRDALREIVAGAPARAVAVIEDADDLPEGLKASILEGLDGDLDPATAAEFLGDQLRGLGVVLNPDVIECYRAAFYLGTDWETYVPNPLFARFTANKGFQAFDKWIHYFDVYHRTLKPYIGRPIRVLEIGVYHGGGLDQLKFLLGDEAALVGADINEEARAVCADRFEVEIGDQRDEGFLRDLVRNHGPFDVIIDDGGHTMSQQITAIEYLFETLNDGGAYIVEDTHTSYWPEFRDQDTTFMEWVKARLDDLNGYHRPEQTDLPVWTRAVTGIHVYDSIVVMEKGRHLPPFCEVVGTGSTLANDRVSEQLLLNYRGATAAAEVRLAQGLLDAERVSSEARAAVEQAQHAQREATILQANAEQLQANAEQQLSAVLNSKTWKLARRLQRLRRRASDSTNPSDL